MGEVAKQVKQAQAAKADPKKTAVLDLIRQQQKAIELALPQHMTAERFTRIVLTEVRRSPQLLKCDPMSLLGAVMLAAQLGLEPGPLGHAYLVPFKREIQFIVGYKGMIDLARRSGQVSTIVGRAVFDGDRFDYAYGLDDRLEHVPAADGGQDPDKLTHVYALAKFKDGGHVFVVLTRDDVEAYRRRSPSAKSQHSPWHTDYVAMAIKTAVRRLFTWLPVTPELAAVQTVDERPVPGISTDIVSDLELADHDDEPVEDAVVVDDDPVEGTLPVDAA